MLKILSEYSPTSKILHSGLAGLAVALTISGCSPEPAPAPTPIPATVPEVETGALTLLLASTDLAVGPNRFVFALLDGTSSPLRVPEARVQFVYLETQPQKDTTSIVARFVRWPVGTAGVYVAQVSFDREGRWGVIAEVAGDAGADRVADAGFLVRAESSSPGIGQPAPASVNRTSGDVDDLAEISTSREPDPDLYGITIADAASSGKPTVVTFATPAFCQTATCGPQVDVVASLKDRYGSQANFIHVEVFDNPLEMEGDLSKGRLSPLMEEWGLLTEPFTFVLRRDGLVAAKFEGFATRVELEAALVAALRP